MTSWPTKKLGDIVEEIIGGGTPKRSKPEYWGENIPWMTIEDINDNFYILKTRQFISKKGLENSNAKLIPPESVILSCTASVGNVAINKIPLTTNQQFNSFVCNKEIIPEFLAYTLILKKQIIKQLGGVTTFSFISKSRIANLKISLPPLKLQKQIVVRMDKIAEAQKLNNELIQKADELFQSLLHKELDLTDKNWGVKKIKDVAVVGNGGTPNTKNPKYWNGKILWLTPKELSGFEDIEIFDTERKISDEGLNHSSATLLPIGTVLFTSRAPIGYIAIAGVPMATNQGFKNFVCDNKQLNNKFLYFFLRLKKKYLQSLGRGATFTEISKTIVEKVEIPLPPLQIQKQIVEKLSAIQDYKKKLLKQKELFQELFDSTLDKTMKGKLIK